MIGLDTNVLLRWMLDDVPEQATAADRLIGGLGRSSPGFVSHVVMLEVYYVLTKVRRMPTTDALEMLEVLLRLKQLEFDDGETLWDAVQMARGGAQLPDALIALTGRLFGCERTVTFDRDAVRHTGMELLT